MSEVLTSSELLDRLGDIFMGAYLTPDKENKRRLKKSCDGLCSQFAKKWVRDGKGLLALRDDLEIAAYELEKKWNWPPLGDIHKHFIKEIRAIARKEAKKPRRHKRH